MFKEIAKFFLAVAAVLAVVGGIVKYLYVDIVVVHDDRMAPTLLAGDQVFLWRDGEPKLGRIVVCENPSDRDQLVIGRVIATGGMEVSVQRDALTINRRAPDRNWIGAFRFDDPERDHPVDVRWGVETIGDYEHEFMMRDEYKMNFRAMRVAPGKLYLMSDYRSLTGYDSRSFGLVDASSCIGHVFMRYQPAEGRSAEPPLDHGYVDILD